VILSPYRGYKDEVGYVSISRSISYEPFCHGVVHAHSTNVGRIITHVPVACQFEGGVADAKQESELHSVRWRCYQGRYLLISVVRSPWRVRIMGLFTGSPLVANVSSHMCNNDSFITPRRFLLVDFVFTIYLCFIACWVMARLWISSLPRCRFLQVAEHMLQTAVGLSTYFIMRSFFSEKKDYVVSIHCLFLSCSYVSSLSFYFSNKYICTCSLMRHWIITQFLRESIFLSFTFCFSAAYGHCFSHVGLCTLFPMRKTFNC
jgi:hypothetical protein